MEKDICAKVTSMLGAYIENKLSERDRKFVEYHFARCAACRKKYYEMSRIIGDLHYEYAKMISEFDRIDAGKTAGIKEYEDFYESISPYMDNELSCEDSLKFRKYLLKSKTARDELSKMYELRQSIRKSASDFMDKTGVNFSKRVIKRLKNETKGRAENRDIYQKLYTAAGVMLAALAAVIILLCFNYYSESNAKAMHKHSNVHEQIKFPPDRAFTEYQPESADK